MNRLEKETCRILDFPEKYLSVAKSEAVDKSKLTKTWMFVNGKLSFVHLMDFNAGCVICKSDIGDPIPVIVQTLDAFVPASGLYLTELGVISLTKKANKFWNKSFRPENYLIYFVENKTKKLGPIDIEQLALSKLELITTDMKGKIWCYGSPNEVAFFTSKEKKEVIVQQSKFYQEVLDYVNRKGLKCTVKLL